MKSILPVVNLKNLQLQGGWGGGVLVRTTYRPAIIFFEWIQYLGVKKSVFCNKIQYNASSPPPSPTKKKQKNSSNLVHFKIPSSKLPIFQIQKTDFSKRHKEDPPPFKNYSLLLNNILRPRFRTMSFTIYIFI